MHLYDRSLNLIASSAFETPFQSKAGLVYIDPEVCFAKIVHRLESVLASDDLPQSRNEAFHISVTGMGSTMLAMNRRGEIFVPALSWEFEIPEKTDISISTVRTGKVPLHTYPLYKVPWILKNCGTRDPLLISLPDYTLTAFTGFKTFLTDYSFASRSLLFDDIRCRWDRDILKALRLSEANLPVAAAAGSPVGPMEESLKRRLGLHGDVFIYTGMHDHMATACLGSVVAAGKRSLTNPAGTTESVISLSDGTVPRNDLVLTAPSKGTNTESAWTRDRLALVVYPCLSGKILDAAHRYGCDPSPSLLDSELFFIIAPSRRRLAIEDGGMILPLHPGAAKVEEFWRSLILGTQFEFRKGIEDLEILLKAEPFEEILLFGGQAGSDGLCKLKSAVSGLPVAAYPGINGASLGTMIPIARSLNQEPDLTVLKKFRREYKASEAEIAKSRSIYVHYRKSTEKSN
jgi:sugar (pentulose or hexulose) kinase